MNLRELLDHIPDDEREWLRSNQSDVVSEAVPATVRLALDATIRYMIEPIENDLDLVT